MSAPEIRIDQLTGLRTILRPGAGRPPGGFRARRRAAKRPRAARSAKGARTARRPRSTRPRAGGGEPDTPGWTDPGGPQPLPGAGLGSAAGTRGAGAPSAASFTAGADPLRGLARAGEPDLFSSRPATGAHEVIVNAPST